MLGIPIPESHHYGGYLSVSGRCHYGMTANVLVETWVLVPPVISLVKRALFQHGILSIALYVPDAISYYPGGIVDTNDCANKTAYDLDHAVALVGFDDLSSPKAWTLRNSWSTAWGELGWFQVSQEKDCGITQDVGFPQIAVIEDSGYVGGGGRVEEPVHGRGSPMWGDVVWSEGSFGRRSFGDDLLDGGGGARSSVGGGGGQEPRSPSRPPVGAVRLEDETESSAGTMWWGGRDREEGGAVEVLQ